jgi:prepilin-type N-terminal cleavage/methylation domain-containing protein
MKMNLKKGFTLIELLVVVAIIGILASVVLASLNSARNKGKDAAVKASLSSLRAFAEVDYDTNGTYSAICTEAAAAAGNSTLTQTAGTEYKKVADAIAAQGGGAPVCNEGAGSTTYAVHATLPSDVPTGTRALFCIDSTGIAKNLAAVPAADVTACP